MAGRFRRNEKPTAPGAALADELEAGHRLLRPFDDDVLQDPAQASFDGAFVPLVDVEIVGDRAHLSDGAVGFDKHRPRRIAVPGARRFQLLERRQPGRERRQLLLAGSDRPCAPLVFDPRAGQLRLARGPRDPSRLDRFLGAPQSGRGCRPIRPHAIRLDADVVRLDRQL